MNSKYGNRIIEKTSSEPVKILHSIKSTRLEGSDQSILSQMIRQNYLPEKVYKETPMQKKKKMTWTINQINFGRRIPAQSARAKKKYGGWETTPNSTEKVNLFNILSLTGEKNIRELL